MRLAVVFPGIGYHVDKPLLYYSKKLATDAGYEIIEIKYHDLPENIKGNRKKMNQAYVIALDQAWQILEEKDLSAYDDILFISKSIGTTVAAGYARKYDLNVRHIFFTPLEGTFKLLPESNPCIVFHGRNDPWASHMEIWRLCKEKSCPEYSYDNANHSIETGDVKTDIQYLAEIMEVVKTAIQEKDDSDVWVRKEPDLPEDVKKRLERLQKQRNSKKERERRQKLQEQSDFIKEYDLDTFALAEEAWLRPPE